MKGIRIEIQTLLLAFVIMMAAVVSGFYFFNSLASLVDVVHRQARSDSALVGVRAMASGLTEVENTARLYILSGDGSHLLEYRRMNDSIVSDLQRLESGARDSYFDKALLDSVRALVLRRLIIWNEILDIHLSANDQPARLPDFAREIISAPPDTIEVEVPRKGVIANLFRKKKTETEIQIVPSLQVDELSRELSLELERYQRSMSESSNLLKTREAELVEANQDATSLLYGLLWQMESAERERMETNTLEAGLLAESAKNRIVILGSVVMFLLVVLILLVLKYIRRNRETQKLLIESRRQTEEFARAKEMLIANVSHEMRTPVNVVYGISGQILQRELDPDLRKDLAIVNHSARHLASLVNDTLDLARINSSLLTIHESPFELASVLFEAIELVRPDALQKNLALEFNLSDDLPKMISGDPVRLKQMVVNLLSNAVKFTDVGFVRLDVSAKSEGEGYLIEVEVSDSGKGISEAELPRVFDEFMQSEANDPVKHRGTGLGLSIVKRLAEMQGGGVSINSTPGRGTRVGFSLKCGRVELPEPRDLVQPVTAGTGSFMDMKALIVDDEVYNRYLLRMILQKWGVKITEASNGREAVEKALASNFDVIFMDIRMPVLDGISAAREILKSRPEVLIIANSAASGAEETSRCLQAGMKGLLPKPYTEPQLIAMLESLTGNMIKGENVVKAPDIQEVAKAHAPVDITELYRISDGNKGFVLELIDIFINTTERNLSAMQIALSENNFERLSDLAHKMAAPVKHIHAEDLYHEIKDLEHSDFHNEAAEAIKAKIDHIGKQILNINTYLKEILAKEGEGHDQQKGGFSSSGSANQNNTSFIRNH
jgi:signal transduction histidine kinase/CheY-like chemotaxis protein/HPt (histidine-containing phosphotransfer) domain-containing protein